MKRLEDIPKKNIFEVPDGYFDDLPMRIQARLEKQPREAWYSIFARAPLALRLAVPVVLMTVGGWYWFSRVSPASTEDLLATVNTETLVAYLEDADVTTDEVLDAVTLDAEDTDQLESKTLGEDLGAETLEELELEYRND